MLGLDWLDFVRALGLAAVIEGLIYAAAPLSMKRLMAQTLIGPTEAIRLVGLLLAVGGLALIWAAAPS